MAEAAGFTTLDRMEPGAHAKTVFDPAWWIPDVDVSDAWIRVATVAQVADVLQVHLISLTCMPDIIRSSNSLCVA